MGTVMGVLRKALRNAVLLTKVFVVEIYIASEVEMPDQGYENCGNCGSDRKGHALNDLPIRHKGGGGRGARALSRR